MGKILDAGKWKPPTRSVFVDGERTIEKLPSIRSRKMLDQAGNVRFVALGNANAAAEDGETPYATEIMRYKQAAGWIPAGQCPAALVVSGQINPNAVSAKAREGQPCAPGTYSLDKPCAHFVAEQDMRRTRHDKKTAATERKWNKDELQRNEVQNKLTDVIEALADRLDSPGSKASRNEDQGRGHKR